MRVKATLRQEKQILFYRPVSDEARKFHFSQAGTKVAIGGNGSSKSEMNLVDCVIEMTGVVPFSLEADYPKERLRPPISARLILQSLTSTWEQTIKPKLQWDHWTGLKDGIHGHWGWIPREFLIKGKWDESWSEKFRTLTLTNGSTLQVMSHTQDVQDFASASVHRIVMDEGPKFSVWRENTMRMREGGTISLAMTPPDDESAAWDAAWVFSELYEKGLPGPGKDPDIDSFTLFTEDNPYLAPDFIAKRSKGLTAEQKETRFHGRFMHLGGRIYKDYTDRPQNWCFQCNKTALTADKKCADCQSSDISEFCHTVEPFEQAYRWPCLFLLDPHPRKPNMMSWVVVDPSDDLWQIAEMEVDGEPAMVRDRVFDFERSLRLNILGRIIDPNMAGSPAHSAGQRHVTVREEFDAVGLRCALADDAFDVGMKRVREFLKPDPRTKRPRLHIFNTCHITNKQMKNYSWDEWARYSTEQRDPKATPKAKQDDFPTLLRYLANLNPTYAGLNRGGRPMQATRKKRTAAYA